MLHTQLTQALIEEGWYREVLNRVQNFRKDLDLDYAQRIHLVLSVHTDLYPVVVRYRDKLASEVLAKDEIEMIEIKPEGATVITPDAEHVNKPTLIDGRPLLIALSLAESSPRLGSS